MIKIIHGRYMTVIIKPARASVGRWGMAVTYVVVAALSSHATCMIGVFVVVKPQLPSQVLFTFIFSYTRHKCPCSRRI
jgi:hypothetical protein